MTEEQQPIVSGFTMGDSSDNESDAGQPQRLTSPSGILSAITSTVLGAMGKASSPIEPSPASAGDQKVNPSRPSQPSGKTKGKSPSTAAMDEGESVSFVLGPPSTTREEGAVAINMEDDSCC